MLGKVKITALHSSRSSWGRVFQTLSIQKMQLNCGFKEATHGRSFGKHNQDASKYDVEHHENLNLKFIEILLTPWHGAVDQDWRSKLHTLKCTSGPGS